MDFMTIVDRGAFEVAMWIVWFNFIKYQITHLAKITEVKT